MRTEWNLTPLLNGDDDPAMPVKRKVMEEASYEFINRWKDRGDYLKDPAVLRQALDEYEGWTRKYACSGDEGYYFHLRTSQDQESPVLKAKNNKIDEFARKIHTDMQFFDLRVSKIPESEQVRFLSSPELAPYRHYLETSFRSARYLLSEPEEKIMTLKSPSAYSKWTEMVETFLSKEERELLLEDGTMAKKSFSEIESLVNSVQKPVRDSAVKALNEIVEKHSDVAEAEINAILADKKVNDELRKLERPDLARHVSDDIDSEVIDSLVAAVEKRYDISKRFYALKAKLLGLDKLAYHERNVPYGEVDKKYSYPESVDLVRRTLAQLDSEFVKTLDDFVRNGNIDVYPRKGKSSGAFCAGNLITQPTYILLNHTGKIKDVVTFAHELGHGINNELSRARQNALYFGVSTATAEVASTFMEDFVVQELLKDADDELKLSLLTERVNGAVSSITRQVAVYKFENDLHREFRAKGYLSKEEIGGLFRKNMEAYMGPAVEQSEGSQNWWVQFPHIRNFFYTYSYASGLLISKSLQNMVKADASSISKVKDFLAAGTSDSPKNLFMNMGLDITKGDFWNAGLNEVESSLNEMESLARKLGKI